MRTFTLMSNLCRGGNMILCMLLIGDSIFICLHVLNRFCNCFNNTGYSLDRMLNIEEDKSYSEVYQYLKFIWIAFILAAISVKNKSTAFIPWIVVFFYFLLDDVLSLHEDIGERIAGLFNFKDMYGLRAFDYGELIYNALFGVVLLVLTAFFYLKAETGERKIYIDILLLIGMLAFFAVMTDMVHMIFGNLGLLNFGFFLGILEDGGELISVSFILWYVFNLGTDETFDMDIYGWLQSRIKILPK